MNGINAGPRVLASCTGILTSRSATIAETLTSPGATISGVRARLIGAKCPKGLAAWPHETERSLEQLP